MKINWYANGTTFIDGEWYRTGGYYAEVRRDKSKNSPNHNYLLCLDEYYNDKCKKEGWRLCITLGSYYVIAKILDKRFKKFSEAKQYAQEFLAEFDISEKPLELIEIWKAKKCKPVFDTDLNYIGDEYLGVSACQDDETRYVHEYFNENPVDYRGFTYTLCMYGDLLNVIKNHLAPGIYGSCSMDDEEELKLRTILLEKTLKIDSKYLDRYKLSERKKE